MAKININSKRELLTNAFLAQLAYGIGCVIILLFVSEGYNNSATIQMMNWVVRVISLISALLSAGFLYLWMQSLKGQPKKKYRDLFLYSICFSLGTVYLMYFHKTYHLSGLVARWVTETQMKQIFTLANAMRSLFYIIGLYMIIAFFVYIIRYNLCAKRR